MEDNWDREGPEDDETEDPRIERAEYNRDYPDPEDAPRGWEP